MEVLGRLQYLSTPEGSQAIGEIISEQAELSSEFQVGPKQSPSSGYSCILFSILLPSLSQPTDTESIDRFATCFRQALKFCKVRSLSADLALHSVLQLGLDCNIEPL